MLSCSQYACKPTPTSPESERPTVSRSSSEYPRPTPSSGIRRSVGGTISRSASWAYGTTFSIGGRPLLRPEGLALEATHSSAANSAVAPEEVEARRAAVEDALTRAGLGDFGGRLEERGRWDRILDKDQQMALAFASILLRKPRWVREPSSVSKRRKISLVR